MKYTVKNVAVVAVLMFVSFMTGIGLYRTAKAIVTPTAQVETVTAPLAKAAPEAPHRPSPGWSVKEPSQAAEFISGPLAANVGELCVFRLSDPKTYADWCIVPDATCYIDSSGSSLAFASNNNATYTILAAIVDEGVPKILTHVCRYGQSPQPDPGPTPNPDPSPEPTPAPNPMTSLKDWVTQNVPEGGRAQCGALAFCYEATADAIESGSVLTQAAAYSTLRTATQTKIKVDTWADYLDALSGKVTTSLDGSTDVHRLGSIFRTIAEGLRAVSETETGDDGEPEGNVAVPLRLPSAPRKPSPVGRLLEHAVWHDGRVNYFGRRSA